MPRQAPWQYGAADPVITKAVPTATVIQPGDLVATLASGGNPYPAASESWNTDLATTQTNFSTRFLGVSQELSRNGDVAPIRVNTAGVHEFTCAAATFELGDLVGPAKDTGNALLSDTVVAVAGEALAIGRVAKRYGSNTTKVLVNVFSTVLQGPTT
jgi:hypothetical protein